MKLTQKKIDEVILEILGTEGLRLVKELNTKDNISEFTLANKLRRDIKVIRHMLYKLYNHNLVGSTRKKDKQKGWYIYYWTVLPENIKFLYIKNKKIVLNQLKEQLQKEQTEQFYACPKRCVRLDFDQSIDFEFRCPECGELITQDQDPNRLVELERKIKDIEKEILSSEKPPVHKPPEKSKPKTKKKPKTKPSKRSARPKKTKAKSKTSTKKPKKTKTKSSKKPKSKSKKKPSIKKTKAKSKTSTKKLKKVTTKKKINKKKK